MEEHRPVAPVNKGAGAAAAAAIADVDGGTGRRSSGGVVGSPNAPAAEEPPPRRARAVAPARRSAARRAASRIETAFNDSSDADSPQSASKAPLSSKGSSKLSAADRAEDTPVMQTGGSSRSSSVSGRSSSAFSRGLGPPPALVGAQLSSRSGTPASHPDRPFDELFAKLQDIEGKLGEKDQADSKIKGLEIKVLPPTEQVWGGCDLFDWQLPHDGWA